MIVKVDKKLNKKGGLGQRNVVPPEIKAIFDLRLSTNTNPKEFEQMLVKWIEEAEGEDADSGKISYEFQSVFIFIYGLITE